MKKFIVALAFIVSVSGQAAFAEDPATGAHPPGQPPHQGQPPTGQPGHPPGQSPGGDPAKIEALCKKMEPKLRRQADACLKIKKGDKRGQCFEKIGQSFKGKQQACEGFFEPMKQEYMAKERELYPEQGGQPGGPSNGGHKPGGPEHGQPGTPPGGGHQGGPGAPQHGNKPVDCGKAITEAKKMGQKCLGMAAYDKRSACWDKTGDELNKHGAMEACGPQLDPVKSELQGAEASKYPNQEKAFK